MSGPFLLGILTDHPFGGRTWPEHAYPHLFSLCPAGVRLFLFTPSGVDLHRGAVEGWTADPAPGAGPLRWIRRTFPFPGAVYNRISRRRTEASRACRLLLERMGRRLPVFNPRFLGKWEVHQWLSASPARRFLPRTVLYDGPSTLFEAVRRFGAVLVKPAEGSLGRRIACVEPCGRRFRLRVNGDDGQVQERIITACGLALAARRWFAPGGALVQERVPLLRWEERPFDLRVLLQRLPSGEWSLTGAAARVARSGAITTHTAWGGERLPLERLSALLGTAAPGLFQLEAAGIECARAIEDGSGLHFFELSFDIGLSMEGRLYVFEANAKPFPFDEEEVRTAAAGRLFAFAATAAACGRFPIGRGAGG